jgi:hypothetical protein
VEQINEQSTLRHPPPIAQRPCHLAALCCPALFRRVPETAEALTHISIKQRAFPDWP